MQTGIVRGEEPDEQPDDFQMEVLAVSKQDVLCGAGQGPGTHWTAIQGASCDLTVAACAGVLADRSGWCAVIGGCGLEPPRC